MFLLDNLSRFLHIAPLSCMFASVWVFFFSFVCLFRLKWCQKCSCLLIFLSTNAGDPVSHIHHVTPFLMTFIYCTVLLLLYAGLHHIDL